MKKKVTRSVLKAMTIGISAMAASSFTAMAKEAGEGNIEGENPGALAETETGNLDEATKEASDATNEAAKSENTVIDGVDSTKDTTDGIKEANKEFDEEANSETDGIKTNDAAASVDNAKNAISDAETAGEDTKKAVDSAASNADITTDIASDVDVIVSDAQAKIDENIDAIKKASTVEEANAAYSNIEAVVAETDTKFAAAQADFDAAKLNYDAALNAAALADAEYGNAVAKANDELEAAAANLENVKSKAGVLQSELEEAQKAYEEAVAKAKQAMDEAEAAKKTAEDAVKAAENAKNDAESKLDAAKKDKEAAEAERDAALKAKEEAEKAIKAAEAAKEANASAIKILEAEAEYLSSSKSWDDSDKLFKVIMQEYYVPNVIGVEEGSTVTYSDKFYKDKNDKYNYYVFTITDKAGNSKDYYYNYKKENDELIIFEKVLGKEVIKEAEEEKFIVAVDGVVKVEMTKDEFDAAISACKIFKKDGEFYYFNGQKTENVYVKSDETTVISDQRTDTTYEDGKKIETTTGTVTKTTYEETDISSDGDIYNSKSDALNAAKSNLATGDKNFTISYSSTTSEDAQAIVSYISVYSTVVDLNGVKEMHGNNWKDYKGGEKDIRDDIVSTLNDNGYYVLSSAVSGKATGKKTVDNKASFTNWFPDDEYTYSSGSVTVQYVKLADLDETSYSTWDVIKNLFNGGKTKEQKIQELRDSGYDIADWESFNWNFITADVKLVKYQDAKGTGFDSDISDNSATAQNLAKKDAVNTAKDTVKQDAASVNSSVKSLIAKNCNKTITKVTTTGTAKTAVNGSNVTTADASITSAKKTTKYGYSASYDKKKVDVKKNVTISTAEYAADKVTYVPEVPEESRTVYKNDNYDNYVKNRKENRSGISLFEYQDETFRAFLKLGTESINDYEAAKNAKKDAEDAIDAANKKIDAADLDVAAKKDIADKAAYDLDEANKAAKAKEDELAAAKGSYDAALKATNYSELIKLVDKAKDDINTAKEKVDALKQALEGLKKTTLNKDMIDALGAQLSVAEADFEKAKEKYDNAKKQIEDAKKALQDKLGEFDLADIPVNPVTPAVPLAPSPVATVVIDDAVTPTGVISPVPAGNVLVTAPTTQIDDAETPLGVVDENNKKDNKNDAAEVISINDAETPLGIVDEDEKKAMSWWWLLIVAAMGVTGYEMYRRHSKKNAESLEDEAK